MAPADKKFIYIFYGIMWNIFIFCTLNIIIQSEPIHCRNGTYTIVEYGIYSLVSSHIFAYSGKKRALHSDIIIIITCWFILTTYGPHSHTQSFIQLFGAQLRVLQFYTTHILSAWGRREGGGGCHLYTKCEIHV